MTSGMTATQLPPRTLPKVLVFFPKDTSPVAVEESFAAVRAASSREVDLTDSLSWYEARFSACGNWNSWALEAVKGKSYQNRRPYFDAFVLTGTGRVGRGTATVASLALTVGKKVYRLDGNTLKQVTRVIEDEDGWITSTGETS